MKTIMLFFCLFGNMPNASSQNSGKSTKIAWSSKTRLSRNDFTIRKTDSTQDTFGAAFAMEYDRPFFSAKNLNKLIHNFMLKNASWIDTSANFNVEKQIAFLQDLFDINEIYIRRLRKKAGESVNSSKAVRKYYPIFLAESSNRQQAYKTDILYNIDPADTTKQIKWKQTIRNELLELNEYAVDRPIF